MGLVCVIPDDTQGLFQALYFGILETKPESATCEANTPVLSLWARTLNVGALWQQLFQTWSLTILLIVYTTQV